ncbi:glutamine cyclotransferase [Halanaerobium saccharolyticum]|uniref:Glutamine cyclotransferase n=1 Tax=Halanaerobium saccharolyticum TaxID=43595 RepID=A0A4R6M231_9FIRM|nr:glutaminyl-peptide cyclotransferase [Halanaerobium saccharolyticum]TDO94440.1 glutamine cyclotransferase [Halanaerobium saccharolyticum]
MKNKFNYITIILILIFTIFSSPILKAGEINKLNYQILESYQHDPQAFTQGLEIYNNYLYEGTGLYGRSSLRKVKIESGQVLKQINLNQEYFGEGITILNDKIYQLTWKKNTAFVYDLNLNLIKTFNYQGQGWGLTNNGQHLIMSNGSEFITFRDPETFESIKKIEVKNGDQNMKNINELEYHNGFIYANIWQTDYIIKINAQTGKVLAYLNLSGILKTDYTGEIDVLNGIAYDPEKDNFLITGKLWPKIYRIKIIK